MTDKLSPRVRQEVEEAVGRSERRFAFRVAASLLTFFFVAYKIIKNSGRAEKSNVNGDDLQS